MNRPLEWAAFLLGLLAVAWVGFGYIGSNPLALTMTVLIAAFYLMGALELRRFHQATSGLQSALVAIPEPLAALGDWLDLLPASLQTPVRLRIEGERVGLPGPAMTPYLVGLLVLLGMLGTFLGMVVTLQGAVMALQSTTDLAAIRAALAAPVKGLGLAFGTSVAGVAASAMLGLLSALCRRERLQAAQRLDTRIASGLRVFSRAHQREAMLQALQVQAGQMPVMADRLQAMMVQLERQGQVLNERLLAGQEGFHRDARTAYSGLARSVDQSLRASLTESARVAGATIQPVVEATMAGIARESTQLHQAVAGAVRQQLQDLSGRLGSQLTVAVDAWTTGLARHERSTDDLTGGLRASLAGFTDTFEQRSAALLGSVAQAHGALQADLKAAADQARAAEQADQALHDRQRLAAWAESLATMAATLQQQWQQAGTQTQRQHAQLCQALEQTALGIQSQAETQARATIAEVAGLMQVAAQAPRAAAEVMAQLRQQLSDSLVRDNGVLEERSRIMATLEALLASVGHAASEQRGAIDTLVGSSTALLQRVGSRFSDQIEAESTRLSAAAAQITGSAVEAASLGEAFGLAVQLFSESSDALLAGLQRIEAALGKSTARSDEQLAYYVAQAREVIDLSLLSQKQIVDDLQQLASRAVPLAREAA